jgi:hypothetical protein
MVENQCVRNETAYLSQVLLGAMSGRMFVLK